MICVYSSDTSTFTNNGLAVLEPTLCELTMTINGAWTLTLEHPYDLEGKYLNLEKGNIIKVTDIGILRGCDTTQRYRIYDTVKGLSSMKVIALPVGMEATYDAIIEELNIKAKTGNQAVALISSYLTNHGVSKYTLTASGLSKKRTTKYKNTNLIAALCGSDDGSIVNKYGAEILYNNYQIFIKSHIGNTTPQYDVRIGKNLTGLSYDTDDSAVVTRLYPISDDDIRYNSFDTGTSGQNSYYDAENIEDYPFIRAAFVDAPYSLIDTDISDENPYKTDTTDLTEEIYNTVYNNGEAAIQAFWADVCTDNVFEYTHESQTSVIYLIPEFVQDVIRDISTTIAENVLNDAGVVHEGLRSWLTKAIRASMEWVVDVDLPAKGWIQNQDNSYSYGTELRKLKNEWAYVDRKMSYFNNNEKWEKEKDDTFEWDWVQKKGQRQKYGNNKRYLARNTYVYDYDGECKYYWFDDEGWWDGSSESSGWAWHQDSTGWWFGDADPDGDESKYIHDDWAFIRATAGSDRKLYYFGSDGYLDDSKTEEVDWDWHKVNGKWYFGDTDHEDRANYLSGQWMKIDGDYYYFDSNGYVVDLKDTMMGLAEVLSLYLSDVLIDAIQGSQNDLYNCLYAHMKDYCDDLYDNGLCDPTINVSIDFVDLSMTEEYKDFSDLEKVCLGDKVKVVYNLYGNTQYSIEEYVKGLTYDCIRGYNTKIEVGGVSSVTSLFDTSVKGTGNEQRLVAGENVTINGNVINVSANTGDVYAGDRVSVTQLQTTGQPIAKIYVNGTPTTIYAVGSDVEVEPIKTEGDKIATITVGGVDYDIYADTGLKYWVETETDIYRTGQRDEISGSDTYLKREAYMGYGTNTVQPDYEVRKANNEKALIAWVLNANAQNNCYGMFFVSTKNIDAEWEWRRLEKPYHQDPYYSAWMEPGNQGEIYTLWDATASFTYKGATWYVHRCPNAQNYTIPSITSIPYNSGEQSIVDTAKRIIDLANASPYTEDIVGISNQDHILYYNDDKQNNYDTENRDDAVYISKDGIFNGSEFRVNGVAIGSFYKTRLYLGSSYAASITLSDSYTAYDLLMIETYNQDDKKNLASMVNVSDLANSSYVGVDGYLMYTITNGRTLTFHEAPTDTNHSRYIKAIYGLRTGHDSGTQSPIEDVQVDGASVVSGGVAVIDLSSKQDALTAGNNVQISNQGVISATDTTYSDFAGSSHGLVPSASSGDSSKYLKGDGTWDNPASSSSSISALTDVDLASLANGQVLKYNSTSQKWENTDDDNTTYTAGNNIQISNQNVISATDTTYSAGANIQISEQNEISATNTTYSAGNNISISEQNEISATDTTYTAGDNISISAQNVISAIDTTYSDFDGTNSGLVPKPQSGDSGYLKSDGTWDEPEVTTVVANPSGSATATLTKLQVENTVYEVSSGGASAINDLTDVDISSPSNGQVLKYNSTSREWENANDSGGTTVVANPSGTATDTLDKLQVDNTIYEMGLPEIVTQIVQHDTSEWASKYNYNYTTVSKSSSTALGKWWNFETLNDIANVDYHEEIVYKIPIPTTARKIRYRFETQSQNQNGTDNYIVIGLKTTLDTTNYVYTSDTNFVFKAKIFLTENTEYEGEIEIQPSVPMYLYVTTSGWNLDIYQLDIVEYSSGGASTIDDLSDVDITTPSDGQVLQYDSANSKWINVTPSGGGGISTFSGTAEPTSTIGDDGDLYFKLRINGTISKAYVKINGTWTIYTSNSLPVSWTKLSNLRAISTSGAFSGQNAVFSLTSYADYQNISTDNIIIQWSSYYHSNAYGVTPCTISKTYNSATGELSITTPICPFYQGKYTIDVIIASGEILNRQVSPSSMSGNTAYYDLSNIYGYSALGVNDIAFEMDEITHTTNYNLQHNITYSYDATNGIFSASTDTSIFLNSKATIAIKKSNE